MPVVSKLPLCHDSSESNGEASRRGGWFPRCGGGEIETFAIGKPCSACVPALSGHQPGDQGGARGQSPQATDRASRPAKDHLMTSAERPSVSPRTEHALRDAMEQLFAGRPAHTDGKLTKNNLWREAGVSRATMNRATNVLADWTTASGTVQPAPKTASTPRPSPHYASISEKPGQTATVSRIKSTPQQPSSPPCTPRTRLSVSRSRASRQSSYRLRHDGDPACHRAQPEMRPLSRETSKDLENRGSRSRPVRRGPCLPDGCRHLAQWGHHPTLR